MDFTRQRDIFNPQTHGGTPITLIGCGSVGSMTAILLGKVGFSNITVYDSDTVESHNLPNQFYPLDSIGRYKVEALKDLMLTMAGVEIKVCNKQFRRQKIEGIVISAVDSMKSRRLIFDSFLKQSTTIALIDPRMGGLDYRVYTIKPAQYERYSWYPDEQAVQERCTEKSIMFNVAGIASLVVSSACKVASDQEYAVEIIGEYKTTTMVNMDKMI